MHACRLALQKLLGLHYSVEQDTSQLNETHVRESVREQLLGEIRRCFAAGVDASHAANAVHKYDDLCAMFPDKPLTRLMVGNRPTGGADAFATPPAFRVDLHPLHTSYPDAVPQLSADLDTIDVLTNNLAVFSLVHLHPESALQS